MPEDTYKYWAFISYSHRDRAWADWLHRGLERYRVPRRLAGRAGAAGPLPRRLFPVFRDLEELPSSPNLSAAIDQALRDSRYLIIVASPYAAVSKWVDQEIARFRALGRGDRILCLIVDGEPNAELQPGKGYLECFPPQLRGDREREPIAADVRPGRDGKPLALLKLAAGLLGVGLDELRRRERRRSRWERLGWGVAAALLAAGFAGLWHVQQQARREALDQQALKQHIAAVYEKGRQELLAHNQARSAVYLNEAYRLGIDTPALRFMLARAMRIVDAEKLAFQTGSPVSFVRFSPNAEHLVTRGADKIIRIWDRSGRRAPYEIPVPEHARVVGARFNRNDALLYLYGLPEDMVSGYLRVWDATNGRELAQVANAPSLAHGFNPFDRPAKRLVHIAPDHAVEIYDIGAQRIQRRIAGDFTVAGFSRDGRSLLAGSANGTVSVWDGQGTRRLRVLSGLDSPVVGLDDSEDGSLIAAASRNGAIRAWRTADGVLRVLAGHPSPSPFLIFNMDGSRLLTAAADGARVWNTADGALVYSRQFSGAAGNSFDITSNGRWVMSSGSSRLTVEDAQSGGELFTLDGHPGVPGARDISEDDRLIATGGADGRVALWEMPRIPDFEFRHAVDAVRWSTELWAPGVAALFSHRGRLIATGAGDGVLKLWDADSHTLVRSLQADPKAVDVLAFSADDARIVSGGDLEGVKIWEVASGRLLARFDCDGKQVLNISLSQDGATVAATLLGAGTRVWEVASGRVLARFDDDQARSGGLSPDGRQIAVGAPDGLGYWDLTQQRYLWSTRLGAAVRIQALAYSPDGSRLLVASRGNRAFVVDTADGKVVATLVEPAASQLETARFDAQARRAVLGDDDGATFVWYLAEGKSLVLRGHAGQVRSAAFSPDGNFVLTSGVDATAKLWDAGSGELLDTIAQHGRPMPDVPFEAAAFSPDGRWVVTGSVDGVVRLTELRLETRTPALIAESLRCRVPWRIDGDNLAAAPPEATGCFGS